MVDPLPMRPWRHDAVAHEPRWNVSAPSPEADDLLDDVRMHPGDRVLDVDLGPGAAEGWRLPFADASFDEAVSRDGLQLVGDRRLVLSEMRRVLVPGGRVAVSVWGRIARSPAFDALARSLQRHGGPRSSAAVHWLFSLCHPADLHAVLADVDLERIRARTVLRTSRHGSVGEFVRSFVPTFPAGWTGPRVPDPRRIVADLEEALSPWIDGDGRLWVTNEVVVGVARRRSIG